MLVPIVVNTAGADGAATGYAFTNVTGLVVHAYVAYSAGAPATTDVLIRAEYPAQGSIANSAVTLVTVSNSNTAGLYTPVVAQTDETGADTTSYTPFMSAGRVAVTVTDCDELDGAVVVYLTVV